MKPNKLIGKLIHTPDTKPGRSTTFTPCPLPEYISKYQWCRNCDYPISDHDIEDFEWQK